MADSRLQRLAQVLVAYSTHIQPGEKVAIQGTPAGEPLIEAVYEQVLAHGAYPHLLLATSNAEEILLKHGSEAQLEYLSPFEKMVMDTFDTRIVIGAPLNTRVLSGVAPARLTRQRAARAPLMKSFMERSASGALKWALAYYPTQALAQDADMSLRDYEDFVYGACHVNAEVADPVAHWQGVRAEQDRLVAWLKGRDRLTVRGPNIDLSLSIRERAFINACGDKNMPDGEIFTGPVEDSVNGWVRFTYPAIFSGREVDGVEIHFENGQAVKASAKKNEDFLLSTLNTDAGARYLGEFAIGTNYGITRFTRSILYDEKIGGTLHMAFGAGYPETGSKNTSALHWDMICDLRTDSEIRVDGELFYRNGHFVV